MALSRDNPKYALCGLNCCLCPRYHTEGTSRCPGCGGENFSQLHPPCGIVACAQRHGQVAYCFECQDYPCSRYLAPNTKDSFISYRHRDQNMAQAKADLSAYMGTLLEREAILLRLLSDFNEGRSKGFYCLVVDRLPLAVLHQTLQLLEDAATKGITDKKILAAMARELFSSAAEAQGICLVLRK